MNALSQQPVPANDHNAAARLRDVLARQRASFLADGPPSAALRIDRIDRAIALLVDHQREFCESLAADYLGRSPKVTMIADVMSSIECLKHAKRHLRGWMKARSESPNFPLGLAGMRARVEYQPLGVVGNIVPWNFPVYLAFGPLAGIFAAGNRSMIKVSEFVPETAALMERLIASAFDETEAIAFQGGPEVGAAFAALPFDHLFFTGSPRVGKLVMRAAAENLTPVTLELGGKSPVVVGKSADMERVAHRVAWGKLFNSGQVCLAPDYVMLPEGRVAEFTEQFRAKVAAMYPKLVDNDDYTSIVNEQQYRRVQSYLADARARGVEVIEVNPAGEDFGTQRSRKIAPTLLVNPPDDCLAMQNEIFGPLLPVRTYRSVDEAIAWVNSQPRPLAIYYFGDDAAEERRVLDCTTSGGACVNELIAHAMQDELPFGGCGNSGMGAYHGEQGFRTFSHAKAVLVASRWMRDPLFFMRPPYGAMLDRVLAFFVRK